MDWISNFNNSLRYIEENLDSIIDKKKLAQIANSTEFNYQRIFSYITGVSLGEYIRRRRLSSAAFNIQIDKDKIIDVAFKYGYESSEAFSRAFYAMHSVTPTNARKKRYTLKTFPPITIDGCVSETSPLNYKIVSKKPFYIYGISKTIQNDDNIHNVIPNFWKESFSNGSFDLLIKTVDEWEGNYLPVSGISLNSPSKMDKYMLFVFGKKDINDVFEEIEVPGSDWAVFSSEKYLEDETTEKIQNLNKRIFTEWLQTSNYKHKSGFEMELYFKDKNTQQCYSEIWLQVENV